MFICLVFSATDWKNLDDIWQMLLEKLMNKTDGFVLMRLACGKL